MPLEGHVLDPASVWNDKKTTAMTPEDILNPPPIDWLIQELFPRNSIIVVYGEPSSGKTAFTISAVMAAVHGVPAFGRETSPAAAYFAPFEGLDGARRRIASWWSYKGIKPSNAIPLRLETMPNSEWLCHPQSGSAVQLFLNLANIKNPEGLVLVIDTFSAAMPGIDENDTGRMSAVMHNLRAFTKLGITPILIHHTNAAGSRERGSTTVRGAADTMIRVSKGAAYNQAIAVVDKQREWKCEGEIQFGLSDVDGAVVATEEMPELATNDQIVKMVLERADGEWCSKNDLLGYVGWGDDKVNRMHRTITALVKSGALEKTKKGNSWCYRAVTNLEIAL